MICLGFLILLSIIDIKTYKLPKGAIPSFLTTLFILLIFILVGYPKNVYMGIFALIMAFALSDLGMFYGLADFKIIVAVGMTFNTIIPFLAFNIILSVISLIYKYLFKKVLKENEVPFIPAILISYLAIIIALLIKTFI